MPVSPFIDSLSRFMLMRRYSKRTISAYLYWIKYFIVFHKKRHPAGMGKVEVKIFLGHLAIERNVSAATQGVALNALAFLYNRYLVKPLGELGEFRRASKQAKLATELNRQEVGRLLFMM